MNAITLLKTDHEKVKALFAQVESTNESQHQMLFEEIKDKLEVHTHIEETILYPQMKEIEELKDIVLEGVEEHHQVKLIIREIDDLVWDSTKFEPKLKVLIEDVEHHIEEEESEMFPKIEELVDEETLELLGNELELEMKKYKKAKTAGIE
jgi:hemerythrin superfamily protein